MDDSYNQEFINKKFTFLKFTTHGSIYILKCLEKYLNLTEKDKVGRDPYTGQRVIVQPGYKQLGDGDTKTQRLPGASRK